MAVVTPNTRAFVLTTGQVRQLDWTALSLALVGAVCGTLMLVCNDHLMVGAKLTNRLLQ